MRASEGSSQVAVVCSDADLWCWVNENGVGLGAMAAIATAAIAVFALLRATRDSRDRTRPIVAAELRRIPYVDSSIELVIHNFGQSAARDLRVTFDPPIPDPPADGARYVTPFLKRRYARTIDVLTPGQELGNIYWSGRTQRDSSEYLNHEPTADQVTVHVEYRGSGRRRYRERYFLDVDVIKTTTYAESSTSPESRLKQIGDAVKGVARELRAQRDRHGPEEA